MLKNQKENATSVQTFNFNGTHEVQIVTVNNEPHFVAVDVCNILCLSNPSDRLKDSLDRDEYLPYPIDRAGQQRTVNVVNESGLYALIFQSRKPVAKKFRKWVTSEVLPAIRKTGSYSVRQSVNEHEYRQLLLQYQFEKQWREYYQKETAYFMELASKRTDMLISYLEK